MSRTLVVPLALTLLLPAAGRAEPAPDPHLHVDPSLQDCSVVFASNLTQTAFRRFVREFGSVSAFKQGAPPAPLGPWGVALDIEQIYFSVEQHSAAWNDTFSHPTNTHPLGADKAFPKLRLRLGLTDELEVGAFYTRSQDANYGWLGVEAKYAIFQERDDLPFTLAVRGAYTKTLYVADMDMHDLGLDVSIGHTFWRRLTPYLGVGTDVVLARETSAAVSLHSETQLVPHALAGLELRVWHVALGAEVQVGALTSYQAQVSAVF